MHSSIRRGALTDLEALTALEAGADSVHWLGETGLDWHRRSFADPDQEHLLVESDRRVVGFVVLAGVLKPDDAIELRRIVVTTTMRGQGFGHGLVEAAVERAYDHHGAAQVWLSVPATNVRARALYESESFAVTRTIQDGINRPHGSGAELVVMTHQQPDSG